MTPLLDALAGAKVYDLAQPYFIGMPRDIMTGSCRDTFVQVLNSAFPGGLMTVDQAVQMMNQACYKS